MNLAGLVLAGGESTRTTAEKALANLAGAPLIARPLAVLRAACSEVAVNAPAGGAERYRVLSAPLVFDDDRFAGRGPMVGVLAGLRWAAALTPRPDGLVTAPCDAPFLPGDFAARLVDAAAAAGAPAAMARAGRLHPLCAFWSLSLIEPIARAFDAAPSGLAAHRLLKDLGAAEAVFDDDAAFANLNTDADLAEAGARLGKSRPES